MIGQRLRQLRLARGLSLEELAAEIGGLVTKQALSKYETERSVPTPLVLNKLAATLGVKASYLWSAPSVRIEFIGYRKGSRFAVKDQTQVESIVRESLEQRVRLRQLIQVDQQTDLSVHSISVKTLDDAEEAADKLRKNWSIGTDAISSVVGALEDHSVHVIEVDASERFDGISAVAFSEDNDVTAAAVVSRRNVPGERQRFNLAHELGHLVMKPQSNLDEEKAAHRFAAAFLCPAATLRREIGPKRAFVQSGELILLKKRFGMSIQAMLYRLRVLEIIPEAHYKQWCINVNRMGWKRREPGEMAPEKPQWLSQNVLRAVAEGLLPREDAEKILCQTVPTDQPLSLTERRAFLKLPIEQRRRILAEQAEKISEAYSDHASAREDIQGGDLVTY